MTKPETLKKFELEHNVLICRTFDDEGKEVFDVYEKTSGLWLTIRGYSLLARCLHRGNIVELRRRFEDAVNGRREWLCCYAFKPSKLNLWSA